MEDLPTGATSIHRRLNSLFLVFRDPEGGSYKTSLTLHRGESVSVAAFPKISFKVEDLLG
jgi:hypothetical protein